MHEGVGVCLLIFGCGCWVDGMVSLGASVTLKPYSVNFCDLIFAYTV